MISALAGALACRDWATAIIDGINALMQQADAVF